MRDNTKPPRSTESRNTAQQSAAPHVTLFDGTVAKNIAQVLNGERTLFRTRAATRSGQKEQLSERVKSAHHRSASS